MKPGERIRLIKESARLLGEQPWSDIRLTLSQHGLPTFDPDEWEDMVAYCSYCIERADDDALADLLEYLQGQDAAPATRHVPGPWGDNPVRVFLSHIHAERHFVGAVKRRLEASYGIDAFVAHDDIHPSKAWREQIKAALASCHLFAAFMHEGFHQSQWCDQEVGWALARGIPILPIRPVDFNRTQARDGFLEEHQDICILSSSQRPDYFVAHEIFMAVMREPKLHDVAVKALAEAFVSSGSYDFTRRLWALISTQPSIESEQLRRLEYAVQTNDQVYNANVNGEPVPDLVKQLVAKFEPPPASDPWGEAPF